MKIFSFAIFLCLALAIAGCSKQKSAGNSDSSPVVAQINGYKITARQLSEKASNLQKYLNVNLDVLQERKKLLDDLIATELLYRKALEDGLQNEPEFKESLATEYLRRSIKEPKITEEEVNKYFEANKNKLETIRASHILIKPKVRNEAGFKAAICAKPVPTSRRWPGSTPRTILTRTKAGIWGSFQEARWSPNSARPPSG